MVQALLSVQAAVFAVFTQPLAALHESSVHTLLSLQFTWPPMHEPPEHTSEAVQSLPSLHVVPSAWFGFEHTPVDALHTPATWHWSSTAHTVAVPLQMPAALHLSTFVQGLPSLHIVPVLFVGVEQAPLAGLQLPAVWH